MEFELVSKKGWEKTVSWLEKGLVQDKLDVVFHVKTYEAYIWLEGDKVYSYYPIVEGVPVTFEIINNTAN